MEVIKARNPQQGIPTLLDRVERVGILEETRNGPALRFPTAATTITWSKPMERVVFWSKRDANPFFHLFESLWMLSGRRDVKFVAQFVKRMTTFSDDGKKFHAAYGYRWRKHFGRDQLPDIIDNLQKNKNCRRQVLGIWDVRKDLSKDGLDLPCNLGATFQIGYEGVLNMVVFNRSNDIMMGASGANVVHFSILQEYMAAGIGVPMGEYEQVSANMHCYMGDFERFRSLAVAAPDPYRTASYFCPYSNGEVEVTKIVDVPIKVWDEDLKMWMKNPTKVGLRSPFFLRTATPMMAAHKAFKKGRIDEAIEIIQTQMPEKSDWKKACLEWLERRKGNKNV